MSGRDDDLIRGRASRPAAPAPAADADPEAEVRARQRSRAAVTAWLLAGFVVLVFAISIVKITLGYG